MPPVRTSQRVPKPKIWFDESQEPPKPRRRLISQPKATTSKITPLQPHETESLPNSLYIKLEDLITEYNPPLRVEFQLFYLVWKSESPYRLFLRFLGPESIDIITRSTNLYA